MQSGQRIVFQETFERPDSIPARWLVAAPESSDATVSIDNGAARLMTSTSGDFTLRRRFDVLPLRGQRLRVSARVRTDSTTATARLTFSQGGGRPTPKYADLTKTRSVTTDAWTTVETIVDVDPECLQAELALVARGRGNAWFDDVVVESLGTSPSASSVKLAAWQIDNLIALARAVALIRYRHPADQAAELDWDAFLPDAIGRVLQASTPTSQLSVLRELFTSIAPTVEFGTQRGGVAREPPRGSGTHLARWHHRGFGSDAPYAMWREGRGTDLANFQLTMPIDVPDPTRCRKARLAAVGRRVGSGDAIAFADVELPGRAHKRVEVKLEDELKEVTTEVEIAADAYRVQLGVKVMGQVGLDLHSLLLGCEGGRTTRIDVVQANWKPADWQALYTVRHDACAATKCLTIARTPLDTNFVPDRDMLDTEIGPGLWMHMPLAVWSDNRQTFPATQLTPPRARFGMTDLETRLASILSAWGVASLFYPYFTDQQIDWPSKLPRALSEAAVAGSAEDVHGALSRLLAKLCDNHATAVHPSRPINGILPVALRRFSDQLIVVGAVGEYAKSLPIGAKVLSIDGISALQLYDDMRTRVSSATSGWSEAFTPFWLTLGSLGTSSVVRIRSPNGQESDILLPHLARSIYDSLVREPRPNFGAELASKVYYIDLEALKAERWQSILPFLGDARAIILDMRGAPSNVALSLLGHFIDRPILSPLWQIPVLETGDHQSSRWEIRPVRPRLRGHIIVLLDGRVTSAGETFLQIVRDNRLATLIGEPSGGTNGNIAEAVLPGGFIMHFTGLRVTLADGTALQGKGIDPHEVVHPTLEGMRAGRDEILAAAVAFVEKLASQKSP
jgi:hypothetical protein